MASTVKMRCMRVREIMSSYTQADGRAMPCRGYVAFFRNVESQKGPQWGVEEMILTVLHECHFVTDQIYDFEV